MSYSMQIGTKHPGLILILVDQSSSMADVYDGQTKADLAAMAVNRVIDEIGMACQQGSKIKDRCFIGIVGYGASVDVLLGGMISQIANTPKHIKKIKKKESDGAGGLVEVEIDMPIWLDSTANNGTPMAEAFEVAYDVAKEWIQKNPDNFPPVIINITDGEPNDEQKTRAAAKKIMDLNTTDGNALILNAHISNANIAENKLPNSSTALHDQYAKFLFDISSMLPNPLIAAAQKVGFSPQMGAHGFVFNAGPETMIKLLNFGSLGTMGALR
jgi:hypothetical protein